MPEILILGASRGLGLELARQYADAGQRVIATFRKPQDGRRLDAFCARTLACDVLQEDWAAQLARSLEGVELDLAIVAAGITGPETHRSAAPSREEFDAVMHSNVLASMQLVPLLASGLLARGGKFVVLSSRMGSIGSATSAGYWLYRASKAALNSVLKSASIELSARACVCMALHPGWVRTDMGGAGADLDAEQSVASMRRVIAAANRSHNGRFMNYNGEQLEW